MRAAVERLLAVVFVVILSPLLILIALLILILDGWPVFFSQIRVGQGGRHFKIFKFRTMSKAGQGASFEPGAESRVTALGGALRKTKLDELPQLFNIVGGSMAFVGPRPEVPEWVEVFPDRWRRVLTVKPGITDPAAIEYRDEEELLRQAADPERAYAEEILPHKLDLYEAYLARRSVLSDVAVVFRTIARVAGVKPK